MQAVWRLSAATTMVTFGLIVLGSVVRTTGSGLACPDWPLCEGRIIPRFQFNVMVEWAHRLIALVASVGFVTMVGLIVSSRELRARLGGLVALAAALLAVQILLGALTVWKLLHPAVVSSHLAVALLFFATLLMISTTARAQVRAGSGAVESRVSGGWIGFGLATALVYVQAVLGAVVSTSHAGMACPDWPACHGEWFPALTSPQGLQMLHRAVAYALTAVIAAVAIGARRAADPVVRACAWLALVLVVTQVALGIANVMLGIPVWVSALHLATATALFSACLIGTMRLAAVPAVAVRMARSAA